MILIAKTIWQNTQMKSTLDSFLGTFYMGFYTKLNHEGTLKISYIVSCRPPECVNL